MDATLVKLEFERQKLLELVDEKEINSEGFESNRKIIIQSQKLDKLIYKYMKEKLDEEHGYGQDTYSSRKACNGS